MGQERGIFILILGIKGFSVGNGAQEKMVSGTGRLSLGEGQGAPLCSGLTVSARSVPVHRQGRSQYEANRGTCLSHFF